MRKKLKTMSKLHELKENRPIQFSVALVIIFLIVFRGINTIVDLISFEEQPLYLVQLLSEVAAVIIANACLFIVGGKKILTERGVSFIKGLSIALFPITISVLLIISSLANTEGTLLPVSHIVIFVLFVTAVGIVEELIFRGCITNIIANKYLKNKQGVYLTVFLSGGIFGFTHLSNILSGVEITGAVIQALCTFSVGCLLTAIYIRSRNIWIVVFVHALEDFASLFDSGIYGISTIENVLSSYTPIKLISIIVYLIPTFYLLRSSKIKEILSLNQNKKV